MKSDEGCSPVSILFYLPFSPKKAIIRARLYARVPFTHELDVFLIFIHRCEKILEIIKVIETDDEDSTVCGTKGLVQVPVQFILGTHI